MKAPRHHQRQQGAVIITVALLLLFLIGMAGVALDFSRLFITHGELQTAVDSCALAAAQELDASSGAIRRARHAAQANNANRVHLQSSAWTPTDAEITFRDSSWNVTSADDKAVYAECRHNQSGLNLWLLSSLRASGAASSAPNAMSVSASAVATRASAQTTCPLPVALKPKAGQSGPNYGFQVGEWAKIWGTKQAGSGELGWYNVDSSRSASELERELSEGATCGSKLGDTLYTPGAKTSADEQWNYRFGIYKNGDPGPSVNRPDISGYSYTSANWKNAVPQNAFSGTPAAGSDPSAQNFLTKRAAFASFDNTGTDIQHGSTIVFGKKNQLNGFKTLASPGSSGDHAKYGYNRRLVTLPVIDGSNKVIDYACFFMLHPMSGPNDDVFLEFRGNAGALNSPCTASGLPGGSAGPKVPVLVR